MSGMHGNVSPARLLGVLAVVFGVAASTSLTSCTFTEARPTPAITGPVAYVTNLNSDTVTPISIATNKPGRPIKVGREPSPIVIAPNGKTAYVDDLASNTVTPVSTRTNRPGKPIK